MKNKKILIILITILVIIISAFLGRYIALNQDTTKTVGFAINIYTGINYNTRLITTYSEYETIVNENGIINNKAKLEEKDFKKHDFIVDFIPYDNTLKVNDINLNISGNDVTIDYNVNKEVRSDTQLLVYFIPLKKGQITNFNLANRHFTYTN